MRVTVSLRAGGFVEMRDALRVEAIEHLGVDERGHAGFVAQEMQRARLRGDGAGGVALGVRECAEEHRGCEREADTDFCR